MTHITIEEIKQKIEKLKNKTTAGNDIITNKMIKCSDNITLVNCRNYSTKSLRQVIRFLE